MTIWTFYSSRFNNRFSKIFSSDPTVHCLIEALNYSMPFPTFFAINLKSPEILSGTILLGQASFFRMLSVLLK